MLRYGNAYKSNANYLDAILTTLERIENEMVKLAEQSGSGCMHTEKLDGLTAERIKILDDDEVQQHLYYTFPFCACQFLPTISSRAAL